MAWFDHTYSYKKQITINHSQVSGGGDLLNFPVLVKFTSADFEQTPNGLVQSASGFDIIFVNGSETAKLDHEIENYNASTGEIEMWVRLPFLSVSVNTAIYCYFGNSAITSSQENINGVWDSNYVAVWHMDDATTTTIVDSTVTSATGTKQSASHPVSATGEIASAQSFNGTTDFISVASSTPRVVGDKTLECWVNASTFAANADTTLGKVVFFNADGTNVFMLITETSPAGFQWTVFDSALEHDIAASIASTATWYHITATYAASGSALAIYLNGVSHANTVTTGVGKGTTGTGRIGNSAAGNGFYTGLIDEVRISNAVRTQGWAVTSYNNQSNPATFLTVGTTLSSDNTRPRYIPRAFGGTIVPDPVAQPLAYIPRALGGTIVYEARTFIPRALGGVYIPDTVMWVPRALVGTEQVSLLRSLTLAGVGTLTGTLSVSSGVSLTAECDGVGTLSASLTLATSCASTLAGVGTLTGTLSANTALTVTGAGTGTLAGSLSAAVSQPLPYIGRAFGSTIVYENRTFIPRALGSTYIPDTLLPVPRALLSTIQTPHVVRSGSQLFLNGVAFRFSGANVYWLGLKNLAYPTTSEIDDALQTVVEMGGTVVRSHTLGISTGNSFSIQPFGVTYPTAAPFNDTAFNTIDYAIYRAGQLGLKLIIPLTDDYHDYEGGKHDFTDYRGVVESAFYTDANVLSDFEAYISHVLNRVNQYSGVAYKNDTTIMAWETGNELSTATIAWTDTIAQYIKSIDTIHLVYNGKTMHASNSDGTTAIFTLASIDILTDHFYPPNNANLTTWVNQAQSSGKAYDVGEYDWTDTSGDTLASFLSTIEASSAISGDHPWSLFAHNAVHGFIAETSGDPYALWYPGQTTALRAAQTKLRNHAFTIAGLAIPASSTPAAPDGVAVTVNQVTWHGVVAANTYDVERSITSGTGTFSVIGTGLTDLDTPWTDTDTTPSTRYYRIRAYNIDGVVGAYSSIVTVSYLGVTIAGVGTLTGTLSSSGSVALAVTMAGTGTLTGTATLTTALSTTFAGVGTLTGTTGLATSLSTSMAGVGTLTGTPTLTTSLTTSIAGAGTLTGTFSLTTALAGTIAGVGTLTGTLSSSGSVALSTTLAGSGTLSGTPTLNTSLTSTVVGAGILASTLMLQTSLASSLTGTGTFTGAFSLRVALFLSCLGISTLRGTLTVRSPNVPGTATVLDQLVALSLLGDSLVSIALVSDRLTAASTMNDSTLAASTMNEQPVAQATLTDKLG